MYLWKGLEKMKRSIVLLLTLALLLTGCGGNANQTSETTAAPTTAPVTEPTTEPTTVPTEPTTVPTEPEVYFNPLNGEILDEPYTGRVFAHVITNTKDALPHVSANEADIIIESYVSRGVVRNLALFTNIQDVQPIGATRSTRLITNQIAQHYDAILIHAGGFDMVIEDANYRELDHFNVDSLYRAADPLAKAVAYRDKEYKRYAPNDLLTRGPDIVTYVESQGVRTTQPADKDYFLRFVDDATPVNGEIADEITIVYGQKTKDSVMIYDEATGKYIYKQYGKIMYDQVTNEVESFNNVIIMKADLFDVYIYQKANWNSGSGYYACGGKIIPINWECDGPDQPFRFLTEDGELLNINRGNTYIGVVSSLSKQVKWEDVIPPEPTMEETVALEDMIPETTVETAADVAAETVMETVAETTVPDTAG